MVLLARIDPFPLLFLTLAPGSFAQVGPQERIAPIFSPTDLEFVDLDDDGDLDLAVCSHFGDAVRIEENLGDGTFLSAASLQYPVGSTFRRPMELASLDVDCDGLIDLAAVGTTRLSWWRSNGDRTFGLEQSLFTLHGFTDILAADVDGDGTLDVITTFVADRTVGVSLNSGGAFGPVQVIDNAPPGPFGLAVSDYDSDGDPDVAVADVVRNLAILYENLGGGAFGPQTVVDGPKFYAWGLTFADIDGDLDPDLVCAARNLNEVFVNLNERTIGSVYCTSLPNSTGSVGSLRATGAANVAFERLALGCSDLPTGATAYFLASLGQGMVSMPGGSQGVLCLGGAIGRFVGPSEIQNTGATGSIQLVVDVHSIPQPNGRVPILPGSTWNFQAWHRDSSPGGATSNFTEAVSVTF